MGLRLYNWRNRGGHGLATILGERLAGQNDGFFGGIDGSGGAGLARGFRGAMVEAALSGTTWFETTRLAAAIFRASLIATAVIVAARFVAARFAALRRSVLGGRKIAPPHAWTLTLRASTTMASATTAPASTSAAVPATVTTTIAAAVAATAGA